MTSRLQEAIAAISQLPEAEQDAIATLILENLQAQKNLSQPAMTELSQPAMCDRLTGLFSDEPELMEQVAQSIQQDRDYDRQQSLE